MTSEQLIKEQRKEFNNKFELEAQGCSECGGFELIDKTKIKFPKGQYHCEFDLEAVFEWHIAQLKKFIDQEIERKKVKKKELPQIKELPEKYKDNLQVNSETMPIIMHNAIAMSYIGTFEYGYNQAIDEDIAHLTSLKELIK